MKILVTGSGGFLGKRIAESLLAQGANDIRLHYRQRPPSGFIDDLRVRYPNARIEWGGANLLVRTSLAELVRDVDCVVHAAAGMRGATADMFANTVVGTRNLLDAACTQGVRRVVLISSFAVYRTDHLPRGGTHNESLPLESVGDKKGPYGFAKTRQEHMFCEYQRRYGFEAVILRPGVIYGPGGGALSPRVGIGALGLFFSLGGSASLPLTYVDNCADAVAVATLKAPPGSAYSVVDNDIPTCGQYLAAYRKVVPRMRVLRIPYWALLLGSRVLVWYNRVSKGQLPAVFTPYMVRSMYRPLRYDNSALRGLGWQQQVHTSEGLARTFAYVRERSV